MMCGKACNILISGKSSLYKQYDLSDVKIYITDRTINLERGESDSCELRSLLETCRGRLLPSHRLSVLGTEGQFLLSRGLVNFHT